MSMIDNDWLPAIQGEFRKPYYRELYTLQQNSGLSAGGGYL